MTTTTFTCNISNNPIQPKEKIFLIPVSNEVHTVKASALIIEDKILQPIFNVPRIYPQDTETPYEFEAINIQGVAGNFPEVKLPECERNKAWELIMSLNSRLVLTEEDEEISFEIFNKINTIDDIKQIVQTENCPFYPWSCIMRAIVRFIDEHDINFKQDIENKVKDKFFSEIFFHFVLASVEGIPYVGNTYIEGRHVLCIMQLASFSTKNIEVIKSLPAKTETKPFKNLDDFMETIHNRYNTFNLEDAGADLEARAHLMTKNFQKVQSMLYKPLITTLSTEKLIENLPKIKQAIQNSEDPENVFKTFCEAICLITYLRLFNIHPRPMRIQDVDDKFCDDNHQLLMKNLWKK